MYTTFPAGYEACMAREDETTRYQEAGAATLGQIDWCISYLRRIQKRQLAARLATNRNVIARKLR